MGEEKNPQGSASVASILEKALALIDAPQKWCRGANARNKKGEIRYSYDEDAVSFCSLGALRRTCYDTKLQGECIRILRNGMGILVGIGEWQDSHSHEEVMAAWKRAIAKAKGAEVG